MQEETKREQNAAEGSETGAGQQEVRAGEAEQAAAAAGEGVPGASGKPEPGEGIGTESEASVQTDDGADLGAQERAEGSREDLRGLLERQRQALAAERAAFEREKLAALVERELRSRGLSEEFAPFLMGADAEESLGQVERFQELFQRSLRRELEGRLRLKEPPREPGRARGWSREALRSMSPGEINRNWEEIARTLRK